jgi:cobalamin biosynthesis protein CobW
MASRRVAACVVTGFLGSGKTTLLKGLLERDPGRERIAVIVNEIGDIGIDGRVLTGFDFVENVVELASGCVCCSIDEYRFDLAVDELVRRLDPTLLVIETTGVADPATLLERMRRCGLGVDAVVTAVDATAWRIALRTGRTARRQIAAADFLVITKADLAGPAKVRRLASTLRTMQPRALVLEGCRDSAFAGAELLLATSAARVRTEDEPDAGHLDGDRIETFSWTTAAAVDREAFEAALAALPREVLRAKGFLRCPGERSAWLFQTVCGRVEMSGFDGGGSLAVGVQAVLIGTGILAMRERIVAALAACEVPRASPEDSPGSPGAAPVPVPG